MNVAATRVPIKYRRAVPGDLQAILRVLRCANFHHVPSREMPALDVACFFVAEDGGRLVGVAGYKVTEEGRGKTTLMAVEPAYRGAGVGQRLQEMRMDALRALGCTSVVTNADRPATIEWYKRKFGYREVGTLAKLHEFGDPAVDRWTTLEAPL